MLSQNSSTTVPNGLFRYNENVDKTSPGSNDDHVSDNIEGTKDKDINDEDKNLDKKIRQLGKIRIRKRKGKLKTLKTRMKK